MDAIRFWTIAETVLSFLVPMFIELGYRGAGLSPQAIETLLAAAGLLARDPAGGPAATAGGDARPRRRRPHRPPRRRPPAETAAKADGDAPDHRHPSARRRPWNT